jgi:hypothetical protein
LRKFASAITIGERVASKCEQFFGRTLNEDLVEEGLSIGWFKETETRGDATTEVQPEGQSKGSARNAPSSKS